jgi:hypothetical protein
MVVAHDRGEGVFDQRLDGQRGFVNRPAEEADVEAVFDKSGHLLGGVEFGEFEFDVGKVASMRAHHVRQDAVDGGL